MPRSIPAATLAAPARTAPDDRPAKIPSSARRRVHSTDSASRTMKRRSSTSGSKIGGMYPSSRERSPCTSSPAGGSTATILTEGLRSFRYRPTPMRVPLVPRPATKASTSGQSAQISGPVPV